MTNVRVIGMRVKLASSVVLLFRSSFYDCFEKEGDVVGSNIYETSGCRPFHIRRFSLYSHNLPRYYLLFFVFSLSFFLETSRVQPATIMEDRRVFVFFKV